MGRHNAPLYLTVVVLAPWVVAATASPTLAATPDSTPPVAAGDLGFSLNNLYADSKTPNRFLLQDTEEEEVISEETAITTYDEGESWDLKGPYFLRSADPEEPGEMDLKLVYGYETSSDGSDDDSELEFVLEWGMTRDIEFILEGALELGDGRVDGNADLTAVGFHTRFWQEDGWLPAVAMRNLLRVPTGYHSSGVDYHARLLVTKSIIPGTFRAHFNPFLVLANGHNIEEVRHFQWGFAAGVDYRLSDNLVLVADYLHRSSEERGYRNQHTMEFGADWQLAEHHTLAFSTEVGLDGDSQEANWGAKVSYILSLDFFRLDSP